MKERDKRQRRRGEKSLGGNKGRRQRGHIRNSGHMGGGVGVGR